MIVDKRSHRLGPVCLSNELTKSKVHFGGFGCHTIRPIECTDDSWKSESGRHMHLANTWNVDRTGCGAGRGMHRSRPMAFYWGCAHDVSLKHCVSVKSAQCHHRSQDCQAVIEANIKRRVSKTRPPLLGKWWAVHHGHGLANRIFELLQTDDDQSLQDQLCPFVLQSYK